MDVLNSTTIPIGMEAAGFSGIWIGLSFVTVINLCAVFGILFMRYLTKEAYNIVITLFVGLGVGSLSGSSFYHLIPQAYPKLLEDVDANGHQSYEYLFMAHFALLGIYSFFLIDKFIKIVVEYRKKIHRTVKDESRPDNYILLAGLEVKDSHNPIHSDVEMMKIESNADRSEEAIRDQAHGVCVHDHNVSYKAGGSVIAAVAWMIIFGDGFHNFIDGISIGASFSESVPSGISVALAVLCEEFPHELGDVAILIAAGMTLRQALLYNLLSAITCYLGFGIGYFIGELNPEISKYAFAIAGGMFLYISLCCMIPEMKKAMEEALNVSIGNGIKVLILQIVGLFSGIILMFLMARYGELIAV